MQTTFYLLGIQDGHGCSVTSGDCLYADYKVAEATVKAYHEAGMDYIKLFYVTLQSAPKEWVLKAAEKARQEAINPS